MAKSVDRVARGRSHGYDVLRGFNGQATTGFRRRFVPARGGFVPRFARFVPARARFVTARARFVPYLGEIIARPHPDSTMQALATSRSLPSCE